MPYNRKHALALGADRAEGTGRQVNPVGTRAWHAFIPYFSSHGLAIGGISDGNPSITISFKVIVTHRNNVLWIFIFITTRTQTNFKVCSRAIVVGPLSQEGSGSSSSVRRQWSGKRYSEKCAEAHEKKGKAGHCVSREDRMSARCWGGLETVSR